MKRRPRPKHICGAPGCTVEIRRGMLMCRDHWYQVPRPLRLAITSAWKERRIHDWSANCLEARRLLAAGAARPEPTPTTSPQRAYELQARMLGERTDA